MTTIYQVVTLGGVVKGTFVFLDMPKRLLKQKNHFAA